MITVSAKALATLCHAYDIHEKDLIFLGGGREDSDGIAYFYQKSGQKKVLKILAVKKPGINDLRITSYNVCYTKLLRRG